MSSARTEQHQAGQNDDTETVRIVLALSYDGSAFHGFAAQRGQVTVAGALVRALEKRFGTALKLTCAGRTDTGVHALCQVVHLDVYTSQLVRAGLSGSPREGELPELTRFLTSELAPRIVVYRALFAPPCFDARRSALSRRYRYDIVTGPRLDPMRAASSWYVGKPLDVAAMRIASDALLGEHNFAGFCRQPAGREPGPLTRRVSLARFVEIEPGWLRFEIQANAFCHQMVRAIIGTLVEIGEHRRSPAEVMERLRSGSRDRAAKVAPPTGLCLVAVGYPADMGGEWS